MKNTIVTLILVLACMIGNAQSNLNDYKYVIVPSQFNFLKEADQYRLNSLTEFLFNKYGFVAIMQGNPYPDDLINNGCLALNSDIEKKNSLLRTKLTVVLKDCRGQVVYTSLEGVTKEKDYAKAYNLALRDAFKSFEEVNYAYVPNEKNISKSAKKESNVKVVAAEKEAEKEVEKLKAEIEELKKDNEKIIEPKQTKSKATNKAMFKLQKSNDELKAESNILYAQANDDGFQLVDSSPKVMYKIKKTGLDNVYLVPSKNAILYMKDNDWILEYYQGDTLKQEELKIKF